MLNILIPTQPDDTHAIYTKLALNAKGHDALLWYTADYPTQQTHSFELLNDELKWCAEGSDLSINNDVFDIVWNRRPQKPVLSDSIHPDDLNNAEKENSMFYQTWWQVIAPRAKWINPVNNSKLANSKLLQLKVAAQIGFKTPDTLISNSPAKIKEFISHYKPSDVIYKTLYPMFWFENNGIRLTYSKEISVTDLPSDLALQNTPGIFQKKIKKAYELRITYFGDYPVGVKLRSQEHPKGEMDWRCVPTKELIIEECRLPSSLNQSCQEFMKKFGLVFGCFDFIVTPDGDYYFLEINEQGQFLWIEDVNPDIKMLDIFTDYLINQESKFVWKKSKNSQSMSDFKEMAKSIQRKTMAVHINSPWNS